MGIGTIVTTITVLMIVLLYGWNWYKKKQDK